MYSGLQELALEPAVVKDERGTSARGVPWKKTTGCKWNVPAFLCLTKAGIGALCAWPSSSRPGAVVSFLSEEWYNKSGYFEKMFLTETLDKLLLHAQPCTKPKQKTSVREGLIMEAERPRLGLQSTSQNLNQVRLLSCSCGPRQTNKQTKKTGKDVITKVIPASWLIPLLRTYNYSYYWWPVRLKERKSQRPGGMQTQD